ncbi:hypothetical protein BKA70DRAFT_1554304 [Coprinopsis sp. MPI-PUGE-AT-0042]|nr:hypothetical protein BKA70DRAFT_1554304 [Coprinopsis sp. MPI-PUGE-AT-0042]
MSLPIIFALLASAGLFAGYMWIYISPLIKDKNVVAPHSTTIAVSKGGFQENQRRAGASRQNLRSVTNSRAKNRSTLPESPSSDESSHEGVKSLGRHAPQYVHTYGRDFLEPGFHTRPPNTSLKRPRGTLSPITPPPPAYVSQPSTPTPDYGFTDAYSDRSFGSPTPSSNERYPYRPSLSDHSPPRPETRSFSVQTNPLYAPIGLGRPRSGSQSSSSRTFSQGNSDSSLSATSQTESGSSNGCFSYPGSGHTSPSSFSIPSYYHTIRSIPTSRRVSSVHARAGLPITLFANIDPTSHAAKARALPGRTTASAPALEYFTRAFLSTRTFKGNPFLVIITGYC